MRASVFSIKRTAVLILFFVAASSDGFSQIDVVAGAGGPIPDDGYDGTVGSMACATLDNSTGTIRSVNEVSLNLSIVHTFVGDLTAKVVSPEGTILTVFSRPGLLASPDDGTGCCGDSSNLDNTALLWANGGTFDSELMGGTIDTDTSACTDDGECDFFPNPDGAPGTDLDDFETENGVGIWLVCVGDGAAADTGDFNNAALTIQGSTEPTANESGAVEMPDGYLLESAYPNPFNPQSQFALGVAAAQHVRAELYNTLGQPVAVLFDGRVEANQSRLITIAGAGLASGMYVVRVIGEYFSDALSVTLLK